MSSLACTGCGSSLTLPTDPMAVEASCQFCGVRTLLPENLVHLREEAFEEKIELEEEQREGRENAAEIDEKKREERSSSLVLAVIVGGVMLIFAVGLVAALVKNQSEPRHSPPHAPAPHAAHPSHAH